MTDLRDKMRRLLAGETITIDANLPAEALRDLRDRLGDDSAWCEGGPDTEAATVTIYHVRLADIVSARARYVHDDDDDPGAEGWSEAMAWLRGGAVARDTSRRWDHVLIAYIVFDLIGPATDNVYDATELRAAIATAERPELLGQAAVELRARRTRTEVPPWPDDTADAPFAWLVASLRRASSAGLGIFWEVT